MAHYQRHARELRAYLRKGFQIYFPRDPEALFDDVRAAIERKIGETISTGVKVFSFLSGAPEPYINRDDLWNLAANFARQSSGFSRYNGDNFDAAMDFLCHVQLVLHLIKWKVREFQHICGKFRTTRQVQAQMCVFRPWLCQQKIQVHKVNGFCNDPRQLGSQGFSMLQRKFLELVDNDFVGRFGNALLSEGQIVHIRGVQQRETDPHTPIFKNTTHLVSHAVKHGTEMEMGSVHVRKTMQDTLV